MSDKQPILKMKLGTLLVVGLILVSAYSPVTALAADDISIPENQTPTVENVEQQPEQQLEQPEQPAQSAEASEETTVSDSDTNSEEESAQSETQTEEPAEEPAQAPEPETKSLSFEAFSAPVVSIAISDEFGGTSNSGDDNQGDDQSADGLEKNFTTLANGNNGGSGSENNFTTLPGGTTNSPVSAEGNFTTLSGGSTSDTGEHNFTTLGGGGGCTGSNCGGGPGGCVSGCGVTSGGGGGGPILPQACPLYLKKFIKLGANNDPEEVRKLEIFLRDFEGFEIPVNGIYEQHDFDAVSIFQQRYGQAVLNPWGLATNDPTGYVYITTTLTINQIYCRHAVGNDLDLRNVFPIYEAGATEAAGLELHLSTTTLATTSLATSTSFFQLAAVGLTNIFNFLLAWKCLIIVLLLILLVAYLLDERARLKKRLAEMSEVTAGNTPSLFPIIPVATDETEEEKLAEDEILAELNREPGDQD